MSRFTRRLLSREVDVLQTHRDQLARRAATRVLRAMAGVTRQRTLPTLAQTLRDYADKANNSGARRFRAKPAYELWLRGGTLRPKFKAESFKP